MKLSFSCIVIENTRVCQISSIFIEAKSLKITLQDCEAKEKRLKNKKQTKRKNRTFIVKWVNNGANI